jgi:hypothetical protein
MNHDAHITTWELTVLSALGSRWTREEVATMIRAARAARFERRK